MTRAAGELNRLSFDNCSCALNHHVEADYGKKSSSFQITHILMNFGGEA